MAIRIKDKWHRSQRNRPSAKSLADSAGALAFIGWRLALDKAQNLNKEGFRYDSDVERVGVISEFVAFEIHLADRLAYGRIDDDERAELVNALGLRFADHMQDNLTDLGGARNYRDAFISLLNERLEDYATLTFSDSQPGFDALRYLGSRVLAVLGEDQTNRWVLDQVVAIEAPEITERFGKSVLNLLSAPQGDAD